MGAHDPSPGTTLVNVLIDGRLSSLRVEGQHIVAVDAAPQRGDRIVDLQGDIVLPGLINAHDHLQLNSLPRPAADGRYRHVRGWIEDINARRRNDSAFEELVRVPREQRLLLGGVKNLLSGVTTVAHHDPFYATLAQTSYPVRVLGHYGWSHSLYIDGDDAVRASFRATPTHWPWIIHAAEGLDQEARLEFERLDALGCIAGNTLLVHGIALDSGQRRRLLAAGAGLIWCPSSNLRLFATTAAVTELIAAGRVALGSDSRLSGERDLLQELRAARDCADIDAPVLTSLVTTAAARLLRLGDRGRLETGALADLLVIPAGESLSTVTRADIRLVMIGGSARYGDEDCVRRTTADTAWSAVCVDGRIKLLPAALLQRLAACSLSEPGLTLSASSSWAA